MDPYHKGIEARKRNTPKHENPFLRDPSWWEEMGDYNPYHTLGKKADAWNEGWESQNNYMKSSFMEDAKKWKYLVTNWENIHTILPTNSNEFISFIEARINSQS